MAAKTAAADSTIVEDWVHFLETCSKFHEAVTVVVAAEIAVLLSSPEEVEHLDSRLQDAEVEVSLSQNNVRSAINHLENHLDVSWPVPTEENIGTLLDICKLNAEFSKRPPTVREIDSYLNSLELTEDQLAEKFPAWAGLRESIIACEPRSVSAPSLFGGDFRDEELWADDVDEPAAEQLSVTDFTPIDMTGAATSVAKN